MILSIQSDYVQNNQVTHNLNTFNNQTAYTFFELNWQLLVSVLFTSVNSKVVKSIEIGMK